MSTINVDIVDAQSADTVLVNGVSINKNGIGTIQVNGVALESTSLQSVIIGADTGIISTGFPGGNDASVLVGYSAGKFVTTGASNVMIGSYAGQNNTTGYANCFIGTNAGSNNTTGFSNTFIGGQSNGFLFPTFTGDNNIAIDGMPATSTSSSSITLGSNIHNILRCAVTSITSLSDERDKKEIEELPVGLDFVKGLKPVKFVWNDRDEFGKHDIKDFGFIAQDLKKSQEDANLADTLKLVYEENPEKLEASYGKLIPVLVKAIQELTAKVELLEAKKK